MEATNSKTPRQYTEEAVWTGHYHYLLQALAVAMDTCLVWRLAGTGKPFTADDLLSFAKQQDEQQPLEKNAFYMVSREGAIGLAPGLEYLVKWIFIPMEKGKERDRLLLELQQLMEQQRQEEEALKQAEEARKQAKEARKQAEAAQKQEEAAPKQEAGPRFCTNCGAPLLSGSNFCGMCGAKIRRDEQNH
jgi:hypothetical protein